MPFVRAIIFFLTSFLTPLVFADLSPRQEQILKVVLATDGYLSEELYEQFWGAMPTELVISARVRARFSELLNEQVGEALEFQKETWASTKLSLDNGRVTKTPGYPQAKAQVIANKYVTDADRKRNVKNAEDLMIAAANKTPINSARGQLFITPELVLQVLGGLEASFSRLHRLTASSWDPKSQLRTYDEVGVSVLSVDPFTWEFQEIEAENGVSGQLITLMNRVDETEFVGISRIEYRPLVRMDIQRLFDIAKGSLNGIDAVSEEMFGSEWRGLKSVLFSGKSLVGGAEVNYYARVVALPGDEGALLMQAISDRGKMDTAFLLDDLTSKIQLN